TVSGSTTGTATIGGLAGNNSIVGNFIGINPAATGSAEAVPNAVAGIILSNAGATVSGQGNTISNNVISANQLDGILLVNDARHNTISGNVIGTDSVGSNSIGNSADGIFLLAGSTTIGGVTPNPTPSPISGNVLTSNTISGNSQNGIHIFGPE